MTHEPIAFTQREDVLYSALFDALPGNSVLLRADAPRYTILAVTNGYLGVTATERESLIGKGIFEAFPPDPTHTGERDLHASYRKVLHEKKPHHLPVQRYDLQNADGTFSEKYWQAENRPVLDRDKNVTYIIHTAVDITGEILTRQQEEKIRGLERTHKLLRQAPVPIQVYLGPDLVLAVANEATLRLWGKGPDIIGKPLAEALPEIVEQGFSERLRQVLQSGNPVFLYEVPATFRVNNVETTRYFNTVYQPYYEEEKTVPAGVLVFGFDVSEVVQAKELAEEAKKEVEKQKRLYETINGSTPDLIYVFDRNYRFTYANKALLNMWGRSPEEAIGKRLLENGYEAWHADMHEREIDEVIATGQSVRGEVSFPHALLGKRIYDYILVPVFGENGNVEAVAGTTRDITEIKQAEQTVRESNERFRNLADESPLFVFLIDPGAEAPVNYWNRTWLEYTGLSQEEAKGRSWDGILHPDDVPEVLEQYGPAYREKKAYLISAVRVKRHDGVYRWHAFKGNPYFLPDGTFNGFVGVGYDIHDRKIAEETIRESEARLQVMVAERTRELESGKNLLHNILTNSSNGISVTEMIRDENGVIFDARTIMANDAAVRFVGLPRDFFLEKTATELDPHILQSEYGQACLHTLQTGNPAIIQYFMEISGRWLELTISKMDEDHLIHIFTDVTAIKESQLRLERTVEELKRSNANLEEFAYAASHDLKEPVRKIHFFGERIRQTMSDRMDEKERHYFERLESAARRMGSLIDDLLSYSRLSIQPRRDEEVDLNRLVKLVLEDLDLEIEEKKARITVDPLFTILGHHRQLQQAFQNLIGNALKYGKPGEPPLISITCSRVTGREAGLPLPLEEQQRSFYSLVIRDNGIGFEQSEAERIFNVFTRLHGNSAYRGSGIGLSIVRKVIENHQGYIRAESRPGEGATFFILLPENGWSGHPS